MNLYTQSQDHSVKSLTTGNGVCISHMHHLATILRSFIFFSLVSVYLVKFRCERQEEKKKPQETGERFLRRNRSLHFRDCPYFAEWKMRNYAAVLDYRGQSLARRRTSKITNEAKYRYIE